MITAIVVAVILYGCLYPFAFRRPAESSGPVRQLVASWAEWHDRSDFLSNILLYAPLGFFGMLAIRGDLASWRRFLSVTLAGGLLSIGVELTQYYDAGRTTAAIDLYSNLIGAALGASVAYVADRNSGRPLLREISKNRFPVLLLAAWLGYRLFAGVLAIDPQRSWLAMQSANLASSSTACGLLRASAMWLTVGMLVEAVFAKRRFFWLFPGLVGVLIVAEMLIARTAPHISDIAGAGIAFASLALLQGSRLRAAVVVFVLAAALIDQRLEPFQFRAEAGHFGWIPFRSFMRGADHDIAFFLQNSFLYGSSIWLLVQTGLRLSSSAALVAATLFLISWAQTYLANGAGDVTGTVMAILIAAVIGLMNPEHPESRHAGGVGSAIAGRAPR